MTNAVIRNKLRMASVEDMPLLQDGPSPSGFASICYACRILTQGPSDIAIFFATFGAFAWGMYQVGKGNRKHRCKRFVLEDKLC